MGKAVTFYTAAERRIITRVVFAGILLSLLNSFFTNTLVHQLEAPVIRNPYVDLTYWVMHGLGIPEFIAGHNTVALIFDALLFVSCIAALLAPGRRLSVALFIALYFIYFIVYNTFGTHHTSHKIGMLLIAVPFLACNMLSFNYLWQALRYVLLFAYSSAFIWKLLRFSWLHPDQGIFIMKKNLAAYLYFNPDTSMAAFYRWLLAHPSLVNGLFMAGFILEGLFIAGFFTKKFDAYLLCISVLLVLGFWLVADAHFFEWMILALTLLNFQRLFSLFPLAIKRNMGATTPVNFQTNQDAAS